MAARAAVPFVQAAGGPHVLILLVLLFILGQAMLLVANWWLSQWYGVRLHANGYRADLCSLAIGQASHHIANRQLSCQRLRIAEIRFLLSEEIPAF
jgi:hypothetical protein